MSGQAVNFWPMLWDVHQALHGGAGDVEELLDHLEREVPVPVQGSVEARERLRQAVVIVQEWPFSLLREAQAYGAAWHALYEPARWRQSGHLTSEQMMGEVWPFARDFVSRVARWPRPDEFRRRFGRGTGHRLLGEHESQGSLLAEEEQA